MGGWTHGNGAHVGYDHYRHPVHGKPQRIGGAFRQCRDRREEMGLLMSQVDVCERYLAEFIEQSLRAASFSISTLTLAFHSRFIDRIEAEDSGCAASRSLRIVMTGCP